MKASSQLPQSCRTMEARSCAELAESAVSRATASIAARMASSRAVASASRSCTRHSPAGGSLCPERAYLRASLFAHFESRVLESIIIFERL